MCICNSFAGCPTKYQTKTNKNPHCFRALSLSLRKLKYVLDFIPRHYRSGLDKAAVLKVEGGCASRCCDPLACLVFKLSLFIPAAACSLFCPCQHSLRDFGLGIRLKTFFWDRPVHYLLTTALRRRCSTARLSSRPKFSFELKLSNNSYRF